MNSQGTQQRFLKQIHFMSWPDFGCPDNTGLLLQLVEDIRAQQFEPKGFRAGPLLVHCRYREMGHAIAWCCQVVMITLSVQGACDCMALPPGIDHRLCTGRVWLLGTAAWWWSQSQNRDYVTAMCWHLTKIVISVTALMLKHMTPGCIQPSLNVESKTKKILFQLWNCVMCQEGIVPRFCCCLEVKIYRK